MHSRLVTRRAVTAGLAAVPAGLAAAPAGLATISARLAVPIGLGLSASALGAPDATDGLSYAAEAIHQEIEFDAPRQRIYDALTTSGQFDAVTRLSDAIKLVTAPGAQPTSISGDLGGSFTLFGGYVTGRNLEWVPGERLVQAWRTIRWKPGDYSVVKFDLTEAAHGTKLIFDHRGFPNGEGTHLAGGWHLHYWDPLRKFLSQ
jgi:activator of HSP90 ATPase